MPSLFNKMKNLPKPWRKCRYSFLLLDLLRASTSGGALYSSKSPSLSTKVMLGDAFAIPTCTYVVTLYIAFPIIITIRYFIFNRTLPELSICHSYQGQKTSVVRMLETEVHAACTCTCTYIFACWLIFQPQPGWPTWLATLAGHPGWPPLGKTGWPGWPGWPSCFHQV